jgi:hypothetical protein
MVLPPVQVVPLHQLLYLLVSCPLQLEGLLMGLLMGLQLEQQQLRVTQLAGALPLGQRPC